MPDKNPRSLIRFLIDTLVLFESLGLLIAAGIVLTLLHGGAPIAALIESRMAACITIIALLLYISSTITIANSVLIKRKAAAFLLAAASLAAAYFIEVRPLIFPPPLAASLPGDTTFFASADLVNFIRMTGVFAEAIGRDRVRSLLYPEAVSETAAPEKSVFEVAGGWISREVLVAGGDITASPPEYALLIGSRSKTRAESDFPELAAILFAGPEAAPPGASPANTTAHIKEAYQGQLIHCEIPAAGAEQQPGYCWTATDKAVVVSASKPYLKKIIGRINCGASCGKNRLAALYEQNRDPNRVVYAYINGRPVADFASDMLRHSSAARAAADFLRDVSGAEYSFSNCGLELRQTLRLLYDNSSAALSARAAGTANQGSRELTDSDKSAALGLIRDILSAVSANRTPAQILKSPNGDYIASLGGPNGQKTGLFAFRFVDNRLLLAPDAGHLKRLVLQNCHKKTDTRVSFCEKTVQNPPRGYGIDYSPELFLAALGLAPSNAPRQKSHLEKEYFTNATNATILLLRAMQPGRVNITRNINRVANERSYSISDNFTNSANFPQNSPQAALEIDWRQSFKHEALRRYPFAAVTKAAASHYAVLREWEAEENFNSCLAEVVKTKHALDALLSDTNTLSTGGKYADGACHYITPGAKTPAACRGKVRARVESACEPGSFSVKYLKGDKYDVLAKPRGDAAPRICATEKSVFPSEKRNFKDDKGWYCFH